MAWKGGRLARTFCYVTEQRTRRGWGRTGLHRAKLTCSDEPLACDLLIEGKDLRATARKNFSTRRVAADQVGIAHSLGSAADMGIEYVARYDASGNVVDFVGDGLEGWRARLAPCS